MSRICARQMRAALLGTNQRPRERCGDDDDDDDDDDARTTLAKVPASEHVGFFSRFAPV